MAGSKKQKVLNEVLLEDNDCLGCGFLNPHGLHIEITRDPENAQRLIGTFNPKAHMTGFPGITHGGAIYTALDCLASWVPTILFSETKAAWVLRSSQMRYLRPAPPGETMMLSAHIKGPIEPWKAVMVQAEARNKSGLLLSEGRFKMVPLTADRFKTVAGLKEIPENWRRLLKAT